MHIHTISPPPLPLFPLSVSFCNSVSVSVFLVHRRAYLCSLARTFSAERHRHMFVQASKLLKPARHIIRMKILRSFEMCIQMYVYLCVHATHKCIHMYVRRESAQSLYTEKMMQTQTHTCKHCCQKPSLYVIHTYVYICVYACMHAIQKCLNMLACKDLYKCVNKCTHKYLYINVYTNVYTNICT